MKKKSLGKFTVKRKRDYDDSKNLSQLSFY
jgi:hypothetical protein